MAYETWLSKMIDKLDYQPNINGSYIFADKASVDAIIGILPSDTRNDKRFIQSFEDVKDLIDKDGIATWNYNGANSFDGFVSAAEYKRISKDDILSHLSEFGINMEDGKFYKDNNVNVKYAPTFTETLSHFPKLSEYYVLTDQKVVDRMVDALKENIPENSKDAEYRFMIETFAQAKDIIKQEGMAVWSYNGAESFSVCQDYLLNHGWSNERIESALSKYNIEISSVDNILENTAFVGSFSIITNVDEINRMENDYNNSVPESQQSNESVLYNKAAFAEAKEMIEQQGVASLVKIGSEYYAFNFEKCTDMLMQNGMTYSEIVDNLANQGIDIRDFKCHTIADNVLDGDNIFSTDDILNDNVGYKDVNTPNFEDDPR